MSANGDEVKKELELVAKCILEQVRLFTGVENTFSSSLSSIPLSLVGSKVCSVSSSRASSAETKLDSALSAGNTKIFDATVGCTNTFPFQPEALQRVNPQVWDLFPHSIGQLE